MSFSYRLPVFNNDTLLFENYQLPQQSGTVVSGSPSSVKYLRGRSATIQSGNRVENLCTYLFGNYPITASTLSYELIQDVGMKILSVDFVRKPMVDDPCGHAHLLSYLRTRSALARQLSSNSDPISSLLTCSPLTPG